jgi:hypothetical protein
MINKEYFLNQIDQYMDDDTNGWGASRVATKYIYQRIHDILNMNAYEDVAYSLSRLMDELAHNYKVDTGKLIGEKYHKHNCPAKDGFGCRCEEDV